MFDTTTMTDRQVNLLARWDSFSPGPLGTPASEIDPETALILLEDDVAVAVSSPEELEMALALFAGISLEQYEDGLIGGVRLVRGIRNL
jgi:hypothetical protein